ncbi:GH92 family glycosyl hydrolase [Pontibacter sp. HSC-36F09]|uniref:GH92 family glycosyl hydrolase n=1 Tax=Pontibacter sp. HSC-36F09 TaxID=2910966 RepID=UPI00209EAC6E|nr:GH92 family glycosyl hydrolase [Pontibacter sp. HSC-36F09]MCP2043574.1 putative alpha-1,2-mannosidase [Pontibacter sp. HSC-36F09]
MKYWGFHITLAVLLLGMSFSAHARQEQDLVQYVNTLQGTNSSFELTYGNTYPTTALPFGMHTWTPQTGKNGNGWKYQYAKDSIRGFQQAHQCSSWSGDYAVFSLMPVVGQLKLHEDERATRFSHTNEIGKPHYYKVTFDNQITTEISPTERGAHLRFSFPEGESSYLVLDGYTGLSSVKIDPENKRITGTVSNGRLVGKLINYFVVEFDQPFKTYGTWENRKGGQWPGAKSAEGRGVGAYIEFASGQQVQARTASSYVSLQQAKLTLEQELGKLDSLEDTREEARQVWNQQLGKIVVEGGTEEQLRTFYSTLFRANLFSRKFYEINAEGEPYYFSPYDLKLHAGYLFTDTGFWDTFRAQFPLNTILHPTQHGRYVAALLDVHEQSGWLPSWSFPHENGGMIGNHAITLLADAWVKGIRTFDPQKALEAYHHTATNKGPWGPSNGREGWKEYYTLGYVPYPTYEEGTAKTLEYAYDDFAGYQLAKVTGNDFYKGIFERQMYNYRNVFDPATGFMRGRQADGQWNPNFDAFEWGGPYTEANAWHYLWSVFHDVQGLIDLLGGEKQFVSKLDSVFSLPSTVNTGSYGYMIHEMTEMQLAKMGQYAHGNQPIQHMIYLYNYAGQPWKAQHWAREVMERLYNSTENGYPGDEDQGQTSSWYVLSALGFYSVTPGTDEYVLGSPVFRKATINLENGKQFVIEAEGNSKENVYIRSARLNGKAYSKNFIRHQDIMNGGRLQFKMGSKPNKSRGTKESDKPYSVSR